MTGVELAEVACLDSFNVLDALLGKPDAKGRDHLVQQDNGRGGNYGLRVGKWKLQRHDSRKKRNAQLRLESQKTPRYALYNLADDPAEKNNVVEKQSNIAKRLSKQLNNLIESGRSRGGG